MMKKLLNFVLVLMLAAMAAPMLTVGLAEAEDTEVFEPHVTAVETLPPPKISGSYDQETSLRFVFRGKCGRCPCGNI